MICFSVFGRKDFCSLLLCCVNFDYARERKSQESAEVVIGTMNSVVFLSMVFLLCGFSLTLANVVLIGNNVTLSFDDVEANFALAIKGSGERGVLYPAEPLDACSKLTNKVKPAKKGSSPFVLIIRGGCSFEDKVRRAQEASFKAAVVYDNEDGDALVAMAGNSAGIKIHAVFVSKTSGEKLKNYTGLTDMEVWLIPSFENSAWSIMAISFISLLAMSAVLAICFFVHRHRIRRERPCVREFHRMSSRLVKSMPSPIFTAVLEDNCTSMTCAICLEDYSIGEKLRILPCCRKFVATKFSFSSCVICTSQQYNSLAEFHAFCVDSWLTSWRTFCPVCKHDARTTTGYPPALESTPLLSSSPASVASSSVLSSVRSSLVSSSAIQIARALSHSPSLSRPHSLTSSSYVQQPLRSFYRQSPSLAISRSSMDLQNASSQRSHSSYLASGYSLGYPSFSPLNSRYLSTHIPSPSNASLPLVSSSSHQHNPLHCSESAVSFSPFASAQTLPEC